MTHGPNVWVLLGLIVSLVVFLVAQVFSKNLFLLFLPLVFVGAVCWKWPTRRG
ncbi:hypothetical protein ID144_18105 [Pseudomonas sp. JM0905a]|uniref:hypothetical protein n=1 Tax=Pseudomonas sp. JM0905a TaxID=2772484 RepID=UPI0016858844|nr:hypothetical protein [Pseudomonas sp. JM0905a]MBD2838955.1 hypothetical protein [Pseudomonas sp. JM0905a]